MVQEEINYRRPVLIYRTWVLLRNSGFQAPALSVVQKGASA